jgi:polyisoprenoid-binding protein YceI
MTRNRLIAITGAIVVVAGIGLYVAYDQVLRGDSTPALALPSQAAASSDTGSAATSDPTAGASADPAGESASADPGTGSGSVTAASAVGTWTIGSGSLAGYRVREQLANLAAESDAVGRTDAVTGSVTLTAAGDSVQVTAADISVDTTSIASDESRRDNRLRNEGLQTNEYPTATFTLTSPVDVPAEIFAGTIVDVTLHGDLTLHGSTKTVDIPAKAQMQGGQVQVQGAITFPLADYGIEAPNIGGFIVSIADEGTLEFLLLLEPA